MQDERVSLAIADFLEAGYRPYPVPPHETFVAWRGQKTIADGTANAYFLSVTAWRFPDGHESFSVYAHLYDAAGLAFRVEDLSLGRGRSILDMEAFYADLYLRLACIPDIHNN